VRGSLSLMATGCFGPGQMATRQYDAIDFGPLCTEAINRTLAIPLATGSVHMSARVHQKIAEVHKVDYDFVMMHLGTCITTPTFLGKNPDHDGRIDLILEVRNGPLLVAVGIVPKGGKYIVSTTFRTFSATVSQWRRSGWLVPL
jgi:hypothetical protein